MKIIRPRLNNKGFILIEKIIILGVITIIILLNLQIINTVNKSSLYKKEDIILKTYLSNAKQLAITSKSIVNIFFNKQVLTITTNNNKTAYSFKNIFFQNSKELYFNKNGTINQGYTILFKNGYSYHKLIFYIGKGWFKIE